MKHARDDHHRADRHGGSEEEGEDHALFGIDEVAVRQAEREREAQRERYQNAHDSDSQGGAPLTPGRRGVDFEPGLEQQEEHTDLGDRVEHRFLDRVRGEDRSSEFGQGPAQHRGTE